MDRDERAKMVLAMEFICRQLNDEELLDDWLMCGVADGDIKHGETDPDTVEDYYLQDDTFAELMRCFLGRMAQAYRSGGLYCDMIVSN